MTGDLTREPGLRDLARGGKLSWPLRAREALRSATRRAGFDVIRAYPRSEALVAAWSVVERPNPGHGVNGVRLWVSFSLYGSDPLYIDGISAACSSYRQYFPGWRPVIFAGDSVPRDNLESLEFEFGSLTVPMRNAVEDPSAMLWRYLAIDHVGGDAILFRDADSRAGPRERAAVDEWLASGRNFHIMRDHPNHRDPILGGMWGLRPSALLDVEKRILAYGPDSRFSGDQRWLAADVYPLAVKSCLVHQDAAYYQDPNPVEVRPYPVPRRAGEFVGQGVTPSGVPRQGHEWPTY